MPENDPNKSPGSAVPSAGSATAGQGPAAGGTAGTSGAPAGNDVAARLETLSKLVESTTKEQANFRSLIDRQMNELRSAVTVRPARAAPAASTGGSNDEPAAGNGRGRLPSHIEQEIALLKFRQLHPDWNEYWPDMEPILADRYKAAPYAIHAIDPDTGEPYVDYYRSIEYLKTSLERDRLRKLKEEFDKARTNGQDRRTVIQRDATISGQSASVVEGITPEAWAKMSPTERARKLIEMGELEVDEENPPSFMREGAK